MQAIADWARYAPADDFWVVTVISILASLAGIIGWFYHLRHFKIMQDLPTSKIRSAAQGYLELSGHGALMEGPPIIAPLTGTPCTWYHFRIQERRRSGRNDRWVTIREGRSEELFLLIDDTGQCVIDPDGARVIPASKQTWYGSKASPVPGPKSGYGLFLNRKYRFIEERMHAGDTLFALGLYRTVGGAGTGFDVNTDVAALLREWKRDSETLLTRYDRNRDGEIDLEEWQAVREAALTEVQANHRELQAMPAVHTMVATHDSGKPYILSAIPQETLIRRYRLYSGSLLLVFFLAGTLATWLFSLRY